MRAVPIRPIDSDTDSDTDSELADLVLLRLTVPPMSLEEAHVSPASCCAGAPGEICDLLVVGFVEPVRGGLGAKEGTNAVRALGVHPLANVGFGRSF